MARPNRVKSDGEGYYHVIDRIAHREFLLKGETKGTDPSDCAGGYEGDRPFGLRRSHEIILRQI